LGYGFHLIVSSTISPNAKDNTVTGNVIVFPAAGTGFGIWGQCNATGSTCSNNIYTGNRIIGTGSGVGIQLEHDAGTASANNSIFSNEITSVTSGIVNGAGVTNTFLGLTQW